MNKLKTITVKTTNKKGVLIMNKFKTITVKNGADNEQVENYHSKNYE